jgi:hypothetical protein
LLQLPSDIQALGKKEFEFVFQAMLYSLMDAAFEESYFTQDIFLMDIEMGTDVFQKAIQAYNVREKEEERERKRKRKKEREREREREKKEPQM